MVVVRVRDLARGPGTLVGGVVDEGGEPVTLVGSCEGEEEKYQHRTEKKRRRQKRRTVRDLGPLPRSASADALASGVGDRRGDPVAVVLVGPFFGLLLESKSKEQSRNGDRCVS